MWVWPSAPDAAPVSSSLRVFLPPCFFIMNLLVVFFFLCADLGKTMRGCLKSYRGSLPLGEGRKVGGSLVRWRRRKATKGKGVMLRGQTLLNKQTSQAS